MEILMLSHTAWPVGPSYLIIIFYPENLNIWLKAPLLDGICYSPTAQCFHATEGKGNMWHGWGWSGTEIHHKESSYSQAQIYIYKENFAGLLCNSQPLKDLATSWVF